MYTILALFIFFFILYIFYASRQLTVHIMKVITIKLKININKV